MALRRILGLALMTSLVGCEWIAGIGDKTLAGDAGTAPGLDATTPDAPPSPVDGATAVPSDPMDPSVPCAKQPTDHLLFCDDFDDAKEPSVLEANPAPSPWEWSLSSGGSSMAFDSADFSTPPRSARFIAPSPQPDGGNDQAQLGVDSPTAATLTSQFRLAFDLRIDADSLAGINQVGVVQISLDSGEFDFLIERDAMSIQFYDATMALMEKPVMMNPPLRQWTRVVIVEDVTAGLSVIVAGAQALSVPSIKPSPGMVKKLIVGNVFINGPSDPLTVELDNIVLQGQ